MAAAVRTRVGSVPGMRAVQVISPTGPAGIEVTEVDEPTPGPGDVLVEVHRVGLSFPDLLLSKGQYQVGRSRRSPSASTSPAPSPPSGRT